MPHGSNANWRRRRNATCRRRAPATGSIRSKACAESRSVASTGTHSSSPRNGPEPSAGRRRTHGTRRNANGTAKEREQRARTAAGEALKAAEARTQSEVELATKATLEATRMIQEGLKQEMEQAHTRSKEWRAYAERLKAELSSLAESSERMQKLQEAAETKAREAEERHQAEVQEWKNAIAHWQERADQLERRGERLEAITRRAIAMRHRPDRDGEERRKGRR